MESRPQNPEFRNNPENFHPSSGGHVFYRSSELVFKLFFCLCCFLRPSQQGFNYVGTGLPGLNKYQAEDKVFRLRLIY